MDEALSGDLAESRVAGTLDFLFLGEAFLERDKAACKWRARSMNVWEAL